MHQNRTSTVGRSLLATLVGAGTTSALAALAQDLLGKVLRHVSAEAVVAAVVVTVGAVAAAVLTLGCGLLIAGGLGRVVGRSSRRLDAAAARLTPALLRRAVAVTVGAGVGLAPGVATAEEVDLGWAVTSSTAQETASLAPPGTGPSAGAGVGTGLGVTDEPSAATGPTTVPAPGPPATVTVAPGDCLWSIAADHLPDGATDAEIAATWPRWYAANRDVVGPDPDLIHPGQVLTAPAAASEEHP